MWATRYPILFVPSASFSCRLTRRICPLPRTRNVSPSKNTRARGESSVERNRARRLLTYLAVALGDPRVPVKRIMCFPLICQGRFVFPLSFFFFTLLSSRRFFIGDNSLARLAFSAYYLAALAMAPVRSIGNDAATRHRVTQQKRSPGGVLKR